MIRGLFMNLTCNEKALIMSLRKQNVDIDDLVNGIDYFTYCEWKDWHTSVLVEDYNMFKENKNLL
jgi:hypothetical protein